MLSLLAKLYGRIIDARNSLYDNGSLRSHDLGAFTVSIGNITVGGTGKTPLTAFVSEMLANRGDNVCILTRGYGRNDPGKRVLVSDSVAVLVDAAGGGDEPVELAHKLLGKAMVVADADRVAAARWASKEFGISAFVLDDGFQHRRAGRDVDIVCIDAADPFGGGQLVPAGRLRENIKGLRRADIAVIIGAGSDPAVRQQLAERVTDIAPGVRVFYAAKVITSFRSITNEPIHNIAATARKLFAFCGLAKPENFFESLRNTGIEVSGTQAFADHFRYTDSAIRSVEDGARNSGAEALITTAKDAVKLQNVQRTLQCYVAEIGIEMEDAEGFALILSEKAQSATA